MMFSVGTHTNWYLYSDGCITGGISEHKTPRKFPSYLLFLKDWSSKGHMRSPAGEEKGSYKSTIFCPKQDPPSRETTWINLVRISVKIKGKRGLGMNVALWHSTCLEWEKPCVPSPGLPNKRKWYWHQQQSCTAVLNLWVATPLGVKPFHRGHILDNLHIRYLYYDL